MSTKISIGCNYGDLIRIKFKAFDHVCPDDQQNLDEEDEKQESSLPPQIDPKKKKLLILNLNGFLIRKVHILDYVSCIFIPSRVADYRYRDTFLFKRPFSEEFMKFCLQRFEVAIWSSAVKKNVLGALTCAIGEDLVDKLLFVWDQNHCKKSEYKSMENAQKPLFLKELECAWKQYPSYSASNTLLIDDKPYRTIHNPPNTAIFVDSYRLENERDNFLDPDGALCEYLNGVAEAENVQEYVRHNRFGLPAMSPDHRDWDLYMRLSYSNFGDLVKVKDILEEDEHKGYKDELELNLGVENINAEVQPKEKKLLIMNLNGFLLRRINLADWENHPSPRIPDYLYHNFLLFKRPYSKEFMRFCLERFEVGIWTSARVHNLDGVLTSCIGSLTDNLPFIWDQNACFDTGYTYCESLGKHLYNKVYRAWASVDNRKSYSCANTLVIDDKPYRAVINPFNSRIFTKPYDIDNEEDNLLDPKGELCQYLNGVAEAEDAEDYVQQHPLVLSGITVFWCGDLKKLLASLQELFHLITERVRKLENKIKSYKAQIVELEENIQKRIDRVSDNNSDDDGHYGDVHMDEQDESRGNNPDDFDLDLEASDEENLNVNKTPDRVAFGPQSQQTVPNQTENTQVDANVEGLDADGSSQSFDPLEELTDSSSVQEEVPQINTFEEIYEEIDAYSNFSLEDYIDKDTENRSNMMWEGGDYSDTDSQDNLEIDRIRKKKGLAEDLVSELNRVEYQIEKNIEETKDKMNLKGKKIE